MTFGGGVYGGVNLIEEGIQSTFSDIEKLVNQCRFHDCQHIEEPGCAVIKEIEEGRLEQRRCI